MSIWLALWIVISLVLIGFLCWTVFILFQQKTIWKGFASKYKLRYNGNALLQSPEMDGMIESYKVSFFTGEHVSEDMRGSRKLTAIEIRLHSVLPIDGGIASGGMVPFVKNFEFKAEVRPGHEAWNKAYIAAGTNRNVLKAYLTDERIENLIKLMRVHNVWVILMFRNENVLLRVDTPNALASRGYLEKLTSLMIKVAKSLELEDNEFKTLKAEESRAQSQDSSLAFDDAEADAVALELEEDNWAEGGSGQAEESLDQGPEKPDTEKE